jgi:hypothetical protein
MSEQIHFREDVLDMSKDGDAIWISPQCHPEAGWIIGWRPQYPGSLAATCSVCKLGVIYFALESDGNKTRQQHTDKQ